MITFKFIDNKNIHSIIPLLKLLHKNISQETLKDRLDEMVTQHYKCIGIFDKEKLIGICGVWMLVKYYVGKHIEVDNVVILPEYRDRGIGEKLMKYVYEYAKKNDCIGSELNCYIDNEKGKKFWEKEGYKIIGVHFQKIF